MSKNKSKKDRMQPGDPVMVTWRDTTGNGAWSSLHEEPVEPVVVKQLGFFLQKTKATLHIAQGLPEGDCQILGLTAIPTGCVVELKKVKY